MLSRCAARGLFWMFLAGVISPSALAQNQGNVPLPRPTAPTAPAVPGGTAVPSGPAVPVELSPALIDLGDMMPETKKTGTITLKNYSAGTLKIQEVRSTCNCTVPELPTKEIGPGSSVELKATFESPIFMGPVRRNVYIFVEGYGQPIKIDVDARVNYGVKPLVRYIPEGQYRLGEFTLEDIMGRPFRVLSAQGKPPEFLDGYNPASEPPRSKYVIRVDLRSIPESEMPKWFLVELDHPTAAVIDLRIMRDPSEPKPRPGPWQLSHERVLLWRMQPGESREVGVVLKNLRNDLPADIEELAAENDSAKVSFVRFEQSAEGPKAILRVETNPEHRGVLLCPVRFTTQGWTNRFDLIGRVVPAGE